MAKVAVLLAPGFEEAEAIITIDILRRMNIEVDTLACAGVACSGELPQYPHGGGQHAAGTHRHPV